MPCSTTYTIAGFWRQHREGFAPGAVARLGRLAPSGGWNKCSMKGLTNEDATRSSWSFSSAQHSVYLIYPHRVRPKKLLDQKNEWPTTARHELTRPFPSSAVPRDRHRHLLSLSLLGDPRGSIAHVHSSLAVLYSASDAQKLDKQSRVEKFVIFCPVSQHSLEKSCRDVPDGSEKFPIYRVSYSSVKKKKSLFATTPFFEHAGTEITHSFSNSTEPLL